MKWLCTSLIGTQAMGDGDGRKIIVIQTVEEGTQDAIGRRVELRLTAEGARLLADSITSLLPRGD